MDAQISWAQLNDCQTFRHIIHCAGGRSRLLLPRRDTSWLGLDLLQETFAFTASMFARVDTLGVASIVLTAVNAGPDGLVVDLIAMSDRHFDPSAVDWVISERFFTFLTPCLETRTVWLIANVGNHVVG